MRSIAVHQAERRLERARNAITRMHATRSFVEAQEAWSDFLLAANGVYTKLENGARGCSISTPWFGRKRHDRKSDPLLAYVHQARNADEHGLRDSAQPAYTFAISGNGYVRSFSIGSATDGFPVKLDADPGVEMHIACKPILVDVLDDRFDDVFPVPDRHGGQLIPPEARTPGMIAHFAIAYLQGLIEEARKLPQRP